MDVILTHEQADFDAIAASLGAYLMNETAIPVTPRRMNRNVRAFLTLYGAELPFVEPRDLPAEPIGSITLVDTQSLVTLKGMTQKTRVQVVDHHQLRPELPENWEVSVDQTGACTTLFVEGLREHNGVLNSLHATLLLLGIYEDTGSLTYTSTTPRDIRAAAFLLEQGASLQILSRYLNPPLSDDQREVYDWLLQTADRHTINGQNILVARAEAEGLNDEISTIAHKLRDLLDPDALFLLVRTNEGIRLVARSVIDNVEVSHVAEHFGGGGHGRAAAALIRQESETLRGKTVKKPTLEEIYQELLRILPEYVRPSLTVRQIMSPRPLVLTPQTPAEKASQLMQRYGYEGYPVVEDGKVKGLLTRRAVDRAISHKLNLTAASLMESGEITVSPQDSIEHLRRVMVESGWGQVPVVDPETGKLVGIVTRTDLLKTADAVPTSDRQNLAARLESALPPARLSLLKAVAATAHEQHMAVYIVGGVVRDLILNRPSPDFDVVVEGDAIALANTLAQTHGGRLLTHARFGTAKWTIADIRETLAQSIAAGDQSLNAPDLPDSLDLISARTEFYDYPTALPTVERSSIKLDLHRRDFTINTMALRLDGRHYGELYDYWGGLRDLHKGLVRVLHSLSFVDDPTRVMRAVRFEQRFGFTIEDRTLQLLKEARPMIKQVSGERLRHELNLILDEERALSMVSRLQELDLLSAIAPALDWKVEYNPLVERVLFGEIREAWKKAGMPEKIGSLPLRTALAWITWLVQYTAEESTSIVQRLRLTNELLESVLAAKKLQTELPELVSARPSQITARLDQIPLAALYVVNLLNIGDESCRLIEQYLQTWRNMTPYTNGDTLRQMQIPPGPHYRDILGKLRAAWLDGEITSEAMEDQKLAELIKQLPSSR